MTERSTGRESDKFMLRFPDGMRERLKALAAENGRSLNAEIIHRLQGSLEMDDHYSKVVPSPDDSVIFEDPALQMLRSMDERYKKILDEVQSINDRYAADIEERHARRNAKARANRKTPGAGK